MPSGSLPGIWIEQLFACNYTRSLSVYRNKFIACYLKRPIKGMLTGSSIFAPATHESRFVHTHSTKQPCAIFWHDGMLEESRPQQGFVTRFSQKIAQTFWGMDSLCSRSSGLANLWPARLPGFVSEDSIITGIVLYQKVFWFDAQFTSMHNFTQSGWHILFNPYLLSRAAEIG